MGDQAEGLYGFGWEDIGFGSGKLLLPNDIAGGGGGPGSINLSAPCSFGGGGGGGGHSTVGSRGSAAGAADDATCAVGGHGGLTIGTPNQTKLYFGGGGGQGGADDDGYGSAGAAGGGMLIAAVTGIDIAPGGLISANGASGGYMYVLSLLVWCRSVANWKYVTWLSWSYGCVSI